MCNLFFTFNCTSVFFFIQQKMFHLFIILINDFVLITNFFLYFQFVSISEVFLKSVKFLSCFKF